MLSLWWLLSFVTVGGVASFAVAIIVAVVLFQYSVHVFFPISANLTIMACETAFSSYSGKRNHWLP